MFFEYLENFLLFYFPISIGVYVLFVLLKKQNVDDRFFEFSTKTTMDEMFQKISLYEEINQKRYIDVREKIKVYFKDGKLSEKEIEWVEEYMMRIYFDRFNKRWIIFKKSDWLLTIIFFVYAINSILIIGIVFANFKKVPEMSGFYSGVLAAIVFFPFPYALLLIQMGMLSLFLTIFRFIFPTRGALLRASILSEEYVKALKPGGRSTEVELPKSRGHGFGVFRF